LKFIEKLFFLESKISANLEEYSLNLQSNEDIVHLIRILFYWAKIRC